MIHSLISNLTLTLAALLSSAGLAHSQATLSEAAAKAGLQFGVATNSAMLREAYGDTVKTHFNLLVLENEMKFQSTEPSRGRFVFKGGDSAYNWGKSHGMRLRGHSIMERSDPQWIGMVPLERDSLLGAIRTHIDTVVGYFKGKVTDWIVLNEIIGNNTPFHLATNYYKNVIGPDYVDSALVYARRADPQAKLFLNDFGMDTANGKSDFVFDLAKGMLERKIPLDGIGLQCHFSTPVHKKGLSDNIKRFGELGLRVSLSEVDIKNGTAQDWINVMSACLENFNCTSFLTWGLHDGVSWIGSNCKCLLFTQTLEARPAVQALVELMNQADPAVVEKRKKFIGESLVQILSPRPRSFQRARAHLSILGSGVPIFTSHSNPVTPLGQVQAH
jgi:endo-1,4-beta-xylanase